MAFVFVAAIVSLIVLVAKAGSWCACSSPHAKLVTCPGTGAPPLCPVGSRMVTVKDPVSKEMVTKCKVGSNLLDPACPKCPFGDAPKCPQDYFLRGYLNTATNTVEAQCVPTKLGPGGPGAVNYQCTSPAPNPNPNPYNPPGPSSGSTGGFSGASGASGASGGSSGGGSEASGRVMDLCPSGGSPVCPLGYSLSPGGPLGVQCVSASGQVQPFSCLGPVPGPSPSTLA